MREIYPNYRVRFITQVLLPTFLFPLSLPLTLQLSGLIPSRRWYITLGLVPVSLVLWNVIRVQWNDYRNSREAKRLGARLVPRYRGRWPGNVDFIWELMNVGKSGYIGSLIEEKLRTYGTTTLNIRVLWNDRFLTMDEGVVKYVLATGFDHFDKGRRFPEMMEEMLGNGIFNRDGDTWKTHRALARPFFARERIADFELFEKHTSKAIDLIDALGSTPFDAQDLFGRFTLDAGAEFLFNTDIDTLSLPLPAAGSAKLGPKGSAIEGEFGVFAQAFENVQQIALSRLRRDPLWPLWEMFTNKTTEPMDVIKHWLDPIVKTALEANEKRKERGEKNDIDNCSFLEYMAANVNDVELIREELLNILLAARDTTASLLTFTIYMFTQHPETLERVRAEINSVCGSETLPTYETLRNMKYLRAVLNETLRLWPPVPVNGRASVSSAPALIPTSPSSDFGNPPSNEPMYIPAGKDVTYTTLGVHRRKDLWGEDAHTFDPDRWLDERLERMIKNPLIFVPFNAGPRICLGQQFALNEASFFLVRLLQKYSSFELATNYQPEGSIPPSSWQKQSGRAPLEKIWPASVLTLYAKGGLWVRAMRVTGSNNE